MYPIFLKNTKCPTMKNNLKLAMLCTMLICTSVIKAQNSLSLNLFDNYSNTINCPVSELDKIFNLAQGNAVSLSFSANTNLTGTIGTSTQRYANLKSVVIKLNGLQGAIFNISTDLSGLRPWVAKVNKRKASFRYHH